MANVKDIADIQKEIFEEIENPENKIYLKVGKKEIKRESYLEDLKERCLKEGASEEEADDVCLLVDKALWGFGVLDVLINDEEISDIRLVDENTVRIKKNGEREETGITFKDSDEYSRYIDNIVSRNSTTLSITNAAQVFTDKDTCPTDILRFSLTSPLVNTNGHSTLLIRKIPKVKKTFEKLVNEDFITEAEKDYLVKRWREGHGILVCGPNGSGKTTFANALLDSTPHNKSCVVIQESEELFCSTHPEMIFRKVIPPRNGSIVSYSLKDLSKLALMESFDIIVIGEIKGGEAADLSYATHTGSQAMATVHSNSAAEAYDRVIDYALEAQPTRSREHFAKHLKTLDTCVFIKNYKVEQILETEGYDKESGEFIFKNAVIGE